MTHPTKGPLLLLLPWVLVATGFGALYTPSFIDLFNGLWATDQQGHGPIVLGVAAWLMWRRWPELRATPAAPAARAGWAVVGFGLLLYVLGRSQDILMFELGSLIWLVAGALLLFHGPAALRIMWLGLFFMLFMVPLPGTVVDSLTQPMKIAVSYLAEQLMHAASYPVSRNGVILQVGQYQLLVADACAGLQTLFVLEAMGLLYLNLVRHQSWVRNITVALFIVPVSFAANVIRVVVLSLITYHWGDEAGQGFLHGFAGMVLFVAALLLIMGVDSLSRLLIAARPARVGR
jgi:exosortase B